MHFVLTDGGDEPVALGVGLQLVDGFVQVEFTCGVEQRASFGARDEDRERVDADILLTKRWGVLQRLALLALVRADVSG